MGSIQMTHQHVVVMRHGDRLDNFEPLWTQKAARPWDPPLVFEGKVRAFGTGKKFNNSLGFPIHRVFVSPFLRCLQTAAEVVHALCSVEDCSTDMSSADGVLIDPSKLKVSVDYGLCEMMNKRAIRAENVPKDGDFAFSITECEAALPQGTVDSTVERVYEQLPKWEESIEGARDRYMNIIRILADKYPKENLLLVTHGLRIAFEYQYTTSRDNGVSSANNIAFKSHDNVLTSSFRFRLPASMEVTALARYDFQNHPRFSANSINLNEAAETTDVNMHISINSLEQQQPPHLPTTVTGSTPNTGTLPELITSAGRNFRNSVWHALTLFITFVQMFGSPNGQNQRESPIIATEHPNDDGLALNNGTLLERVTGVGILNNSTEENPNFPNPVGDEEEGEVEVEVEVEGEGEGVSGDDPSIRGIISQQTTRWKVPIVAPFALRVVLCLVIVFFGVKQGEHIAKLFKLLFVVGSGVAFATYSIISWISDRSDYNILKGIYHVGCNLAFISVLLIIYTTT